MGRETPSSRSSSEGERKQVTVLFADVAGFTSLSEELDPEEVRDLMEPCLDIMTDVVNSYEGTVAQFTGDGIMALFGAPVAFEDAPVRAVRAAIEMRERLSAYADELLGKGISFEVRIGLNTGLVVVGSMGSDQAVEYTAIGDTVNLASRMESAAMPGAVLVSESTYRLVQGFFEFEPLENWRSRGRGSRLGPTGRLLPKRPRPASRPPCRPASPHSSEGPTNYRSSGNVLRGLEPEMPRWWAWRESPGWANPASSSSSGSFSHKGNTLTSRGAAYTTGSPSPTYPS